MPRLRSIAAASVVILMGMDAASATTVAIASKATFLSDTTGQSTTGFNSVGASGVGSGPLALGAFYSAGLALSIDGMTFSATDTGVNVNSAHYYDVATPPLIDLSNQYLTNGSPLTGAPLTLLIALPSPVTAFGLDFSGKFFNTLATFALSNGFSTTVPVDDFDYPVLSTQFLGFLSNTPFDTITLTVPNDAAWVVEDVTGATAKVVPEPATWAMLALGFGGLSLCVRHRRACGAAKLAPEA